MEDRQPGAGADGMRRGGSPLERALVELIVASPKMLPDDLSAWVERAGGHLGGRDVTLLLVDLDQAELRPLGGGSATHPVESSTAGRAYRTEDVVEEAHDGGTQLWVPILDSAERVGVLGAVVDEVSPDALFQWTVLAGFLGELVVTKSRYGDAIATSRRIRPVSVSAEMRWALLPPLTFTSPDIVVAGIVQPAYDIAGDTFDYSVSSTCAEFALFDAMGHGVEAARMANLAVGAYRNSRRHGVDLTQTIRTLDELIQSQFGDSRYVTGQVASIDLGSGVVTAINAGHPAPLVFHADGTSEELPCARSLPIGLDAEPRASLDTQLREGDVLLFHTDGVTEARMRSGGFVGNDRLQGLVSELLGAKLRPAEILRQVVRDLLGDATRLRDDATLLMVGWRIGDEALPPVIRVVDDGIT